MSFQTLMNRPFIFVGGKGGVGKTTLSQSIANVLSNEGKKTLWVEIENPLCAAGQKRNISETLDELSADPVVAFKEYIEQKLRVPLLANTLIKSSFVKNMAKAAPGFHQMIVLGKILSEHKHYDHIVVDMPSTGQGLTLFHGTKNFANLLRGGLVEKDAREMLDELANAERTVFLIATISEEMPIQESIELTEYMKELFPSNPPYIVVNKRYPSPKTEQENIYDRNPIPSSVQDYFDCRKTIEAKNLKTLENEKLSYFELKFKAIPFVNDSQEMKRNLIQALGSSLSKIRLTNVH